MNAQLPQLTARSACAIEVSLARSSDEFRALESDWDALYEMSGRTNPFLSYAWTRACFDEGKTVEPFIVTLRRGGKLVGIAPLCISTRFGLRALRFIAEERSDYLGFLCEGGSEAIERRLVAELIELEFLWDLILLRNLAEPFTGLGTIESSQGICCHRVQRTTSAYCHWDGDWDSLHEGGPLWLKQMRNRRRRFLKNGRTVLRFTGVQAAERLDLVAEVEAKSWKGRQGLARFQPGPGQEILRGAFLAKGSQLELSLAFSDKRAIAFEVDFVTPDRLWMYQYSYDEAYANLRAGSVIQYMNIEYAWKRGIREYDFLMGDESYKANRTTALRPIYSLAVHQRTAWGWLAYCSIVGVRWKLRQIPAVKALYVRAKQLFAHGRPAPVALRART